MKISVVAALYAPPPPYLDQSGYPSSGLHPDQHVIVLRQFSSLTDYASAGFTRRPAFLKEESWTQYKAVQF